MTGARVIDAGRVPPGPRGRFPLGSLRDLQRDQLGFYSACARDFGDLVRVRLGFRHALLIYHPDAIEQVLVTRSRDFHKSPGVRLLKPLLGDGLLLSEDDFWLRQRRLVQPAFHRQRIAAYGEVMTTQTTLRLAHWQHGDELDLHAELMALTQAIVAKTLFGADVAADAHAVGRAIQILTQDFNDRIGSLLQVLPFWVPTPANVKARRAIRSLEAIVYRIIAARRRTAEDRGDLLSILLQAQDADDGARMTDRQVRDEVMTLFIAGHETTAVALSWTWYLLAQHPDIDTRLAAELHTVLGGRVPTAADLPRLTYTGMVVSEAMRLYPPAYGIGRQVAKPTEIAGHPLAPGIIVILPTWVVHRDARWFPEPEVFRPERWGEEATRRLPRFAYFPFGGGPRQCIGNAFATMEAVLLLATIAQRFRLVLVPGQDIRPTPYVTLRPEPGIRMRLERR